MRITFVTSGLEHLGIEALSAYVQERGHDVSLVYETKPFSTNSGPNNRFLANLLEPKAAHTAQRIIGTRPDVLAFSSYTVTHAWSVQVARLVKREIPVPIVFGGPHVSGAPEHSIREAAIDAVVEGEGEGALVDLLDCAERDRFGRTDVPNVWFRGDAGPIRNPLRPLIDDLDELPYGDKEGFYRAIPSFEQDFYVISRRGCPYRCSFCEYSIFPKQYPGAKPVRRRSVEHLMGELRQWKRRGRMRRLWFWDAIFTLDVRWMEEFADAYARDIGLPFECYTHPRAMTRDMARHLARAGCDVVRVGVQTVNSDTLAQMDRLGDAERVELTVGYLNEFGLAYKLDHILGLPGEGPEDQRQAVRFYNRVRPARVTTHWMAYLPGTTALDRARDEGILSAEEVEQILRGENTDGFDGPRMLRGEHKAQAAEIRRLAVLLELMPLLPRGAIDWLLESGNYRYFSSWQAARQLVSFLLAFKHRPERARLRQSVETVLRTAVPPALRPWFEKRRSIGELPRLVPVTRGALEGAPRP